MVTLKDIARVCGVSTATVSYVVNKGPRPVLPATRERVQKAIADLGYHPNAHARGLRGMRTNTLGIVFPHVEAQPFDNVYFAPVLSGIVDVATRKHMATMLFTSLTWEEAQASAPKLCDGRCDGFLLIAPLTQCQLAQDLLARRVPVVVVGTHPENVRLHTVDADNVMGGRLATEHLVALGHRRIAIGTGNPRSTSSGERLVGYRQVLRENGIPIDESLILPDPLVTGGRYEDTFRKLLADPKQRPTAIFCVQDIMAFAAMTVARELDLRIPDDLSVVGFDDIDAAAGFRPPLTTIKQPMRQIGLKAAELVCNDIDEMGADPIDHLYDVQLIKRSSTGPPPGASGTGLI